MQYRYINLYTNNPTAGATDGTPISIEGAFTAPLSFVLDTRQSTSQILPVAIRTESGYITTGTTTISDNNDTNDRLSLCWTPDGEFADSISTAESISSVNTIFYVQASATGDYEPTTDRSMRLKVNATIASAG